MHLLLLLALASVVTANVPVKNGWKPKNYGSCTKPYKNASPTDPDVAESVQSNSQGKTCNFNPSGPSGLPGLPAIYAQGYLLAASQDLYNGKHTQVNFKTDCDTKKLSAADAADGHKQCAQGCGECLLVSGDMGSHVFIINEIADVNAVGQNGHGLNLHLDHRHRKEVTDIGSVARNIQYKRVPCPTSGPIKIRISDSWGGWATYFVAYNYKMGLLSAFILGQCDSISDPTVKCDPLPVAVPRGWTNRFQWEVYVMPWSANDYHNEKNVWRTNGKDKNTPFIVRLKSVTGETVDCYGITATKGKIFDCKDKNGKDQQFTGTADNTPCGGSGGSPPPPPPKTPPPPPKTPPKVPPPPPKTPPTSPPGSGKAFDFHTKWTKNKNKGYLDGTHFILSTGPYQAGHPVYYHTFKWGSLVYLRYSDLVKAWIIVDKPTAQYALKGMLASSGDPCKGGGNWKIPKEMWGGKRQYWVPRTDTNAGRWETLWNGVTCDTAAAVVEGEDYRMQTHRSALAPQTDGKLSVTAIALIVGVAVGVVAVAVVAAYMFVNRRDTSEEYKEMEEIEPEAAQE